MKIKTMDKKSTSYLIYGLLLMVVAPVVFVILAIPSTDAPSAREKSFEILWVLCAYASACFGMVLCLVGIIAKGTALGAMESK